MTVPGQFRGKIKIMITSKIKNQRAGAQGGFVLKSLAAAADTFLSC